MTRALTWRFVDGTVGWFVDTLHPKHLDERLAMFDALPELHAAIVEVEIIEATPTTQRDGAPIPDLEGGSP